MTAALIVLVVGLVALVAGLATLGCAVLARRRDAGAVEPAEVADIHPSVLVEPGTETARGRMSRAALLGLIVGETESAIVVVDRHRDVVLYNEQAHHLGLVRDQLIDDKIWRAVEPMFERPIMASEPPTTAYGDQRADIHTDHDLDMLVDHDLDVRFEFRPPHYTSGFVSTGRVTSRPVLGVRCLARLVSAVPGDNPVTERGFAGGSSTDGRRADAARTERYAVIYGTDDSENLRVEATRRDFVANVSHELKTPVGAIGLLTEALLESNDDPEAVDHFGRRVIAESTRMGNMVNELISLSRLQDSEPLTDLEIVDVDALIADALSHAQIPAEAAKTYLSSDGPSGLRVRGDRGLLLTALDNLINNAIAYSPANSTVSVSRRLVTEADGREMVAIAVTDRGIGIAPRDQQRVFERFFRVDKARSRATGGTGLGLAIVKHVAANHDGHISLWSKPGTGSTFTLSIPRVVPDDELLASPDMEDHSTDRSQRGGTSRVDRHGPSTPIRPTPTHQKELIR